MGLFFAYSIQSAVCLAIFYLFYKVLLSRETFHRFNRGALLSMLVLAWVIPAIWVFFSFSDFFETAVIDTQLSTSDFAVSIQEASIQFTDKSKVGHHTFLSVLLLTYFAGCVACLLFMAISTIHIIRIIRRGKCVTNENGIRLILLEDACTPFSWMHYVVISRFDYEEAGATILAHEKAHIRLHHSFDLTVAQIGIITQWFNPAAWLLYQELQYIHEYEADETVIRQGINTRQYQLLLIKKAVGTRLYSMANSFNHSNLKKRITMMLQKKSNAWARLKYAYVLPLAATTVVVFAHPEISQQFEEISSAKISHFASKTSTNGVKNLLKTDDSDPTKKGSPTKITPMSPGSAENTDPQSPELMPPKKTTATNKTVVKTNREIASQSPTPIQREASTVSNNTREVEQDLYTYGETKEISRPVQTTNSDMPANTTDSIYKVVDRMPEFPGGVDALLKFITDNIRYPQDAADNGIQGRINCTFVIEKDGSISNIKVIRSINPLLDAEAIRLLKIMPKWTPGKNQEEEVRTMYSLPIKFKLPEGQKKETPPATSE